MFTLYKLHSDITNMYYIGVSNNLKKRLCSHTYKARKGDSDFPIYLHMKEIGIDTFIITPLASFKDKEAAYDLEELVISEIKSSERLSKYLLNSANGGVGGFVVPNHKKEEWIEKIRAARIGKQPALGMKHTQKTKDICGAAGRLRWDLYGRYPVEVIDIPFKDAKKKYGISKTHYYRLRKQNEK